MWLLRYLFFSVVLGMFAFVVLLFLGQNQRVEQLDFFGLEYTTNLVWVLLGAGALGVLMTLLLLLPGRIGVALHNRSLERDLRYLEHDLLRLQEQRERMLARHELLLDTHERVLQSYQRLVAEVGRVTAERDQARTQLAATGSGRVPLVVRTRATTPRLAIVPPSVAAKSSASSANETAAPTTASVVQASAPSPAVPLATPAVRANDQPSADGLTHAAPVLTPMLPEMPSIEDTPARGNPARAVALAITSTEPAVSAAPVGAARTPMVAAAETPRDRPTPPARTVLSSLSTLRARFVTNIVTPLAQETAMLPDQLRDCVRQDIADLSAMVVNVRGVLEAKLARVERTSRPGVPSGSIAGGDDLG